MNIGGRIRVVINYLTYPLAIIFSHSAHIRMMYDIYQVPQGLNRDNNRSLVDVSIVVCARNAIRTINDCLHSILISNPGEIIIIDGNSTDGTLVVARQYTDKIYSDGRKGIGYARQLGAEKATRKYVAYVDSDVVLPKNSLACLISEISQGEYSGIHAQVRAYHTETYWEWAENEWFRCIFNRLGDNLATGCITMVYPRDIILKYKFNPYFAVFGSPEDSDFCSRLRQGGHKLRVSQRAFVYHQLRANLKEFIKQRWAYGKGTCLYYHHKRSWVGLLNMPMLLAVGIIVSIGRRNLKMLPYYFVWSAVATSGEIYQLGRLAFKSLRNMH